jgi:hypothetical protein
MSMRTKSRLSTGGGEPGMSMKTKALSPSKAGMLLKRQVVSRWPAGLPLHTPLADLESFEDGFGFIEAFLVFTGGNGVRNDTGPSL